MREVALSSVRTIESYTPELIVQLEVTLQLHDYLVSRLVRFQVSLEVKDAFKTKLAGHQIPGVLPQHCSTWLELPRQGKLH